MSSGERPIGAAKGKQSDTEALFQPPPPPPLPFQCFGPTAKILLRRLQRQEDVSLKMFGPPSVETIEEPKEEGCPSHPPPPF